MSDKPQVVLYGDEYCAYCAAARMLFTKKGVQFEDVVVSRDPARFDEMQARSGGRRSIPQIFVGDVHVGGFDDLCALDKSGELDKLLAGETAGEPSL
jgi:glutaredoxin 3